MPTPRKRNSAAGFSKEEETSVVEPTSAERAEEIEETAKEETPFVPEAIQPTEYVETHPDPAPVAEAPKPVTPGLTLQPPPKRHPRNIPKFSRFK